MKKLFDPTVASSLPAGFPRKGIATAITALASSLTDKATNQRRRPLPLCDSSGKHKINGSGNNYSLFINHGILGTHRLPQASEALNLADGLIAI
jgi:hypothetical protein